MPPTSVNNFTAKFWIIFFTLGPYFDRRCFQRFGSTSLPKCTMCVYPPQNLKILQISALSSDKLLSRGHFAEFKNIFKNRHKTHINAICFCAIGTQFVMNFRKWRNKSIWLCAPLRRMEEMRVSIIYY